MRTIDMQTWPRKEHFAFFNTFDHPHVAMCANVDLTAFYPVVKAHDHSLTVAIVYVIARDPGDSGWPGPVWGVGKAEAYDTNSANALIEAIVTEL